MYIMNQRGNMECNITRPLYLSSTSFLYLPIITTRVSALTRASLIVYMGILHYTVALCYCPLGIWQLTTNGEDFIMWLSRSNSLAVLPGVQQVPKEMDLAPQTSKSTNKQTQTRWGGSQCVLSSFHPLLLYYLFIYFFFKEVSRQFKPKE